MAVALVLPAAARAGELVAPGAKAGALAVTASGSPRVAYVSGSGLYVASRSSSGTWSRGRAALLPSASAVVAGLAVSRSGAPAVLAEASNGRWLTVAWRASGSWQVVRLVRRVRGALGRAGLTLDARGRPVVAYALWRASGATFLRLVRWEDGRFRTHRVTRAGFPPSGVPPAAAPVRLPNGAIRVVEAYGAGGTAAIDWMRLRHDWVGQFLYSSPLGSLAGPVEAAAAPNGVVYSAWTQTFPSLDEIGIVLAAHRDPVQASVVLEHASLAGFALAGGIPLVAANDAVEGLPLGLLRDAGGDLDELDGSVDALAVDSTGAQQILDATDGGLWWFRAAGPTPHVSLVATPISGGIALSGQVLGATGSAVTIYRELPGRPRVAVASAPLAADGSFSAQDAPGPGRFLYRAVYSDAGLPAAALLRTPVEQGP